MDPLIEWVLLQRLSRAAVSQRQRDTALETHRPWCGGTPWPEARCRSAPGRSWGCLARATGLPSGCRPCRRSKATDEGRRRAAGRCPRQTRRRTRCREGSGRWQQGRPCTWVPPADPPAPRESDLTSNPECEHRAVQSSVTCGQGDSQRSTILLRRQRRPSSATQVEHHTMMRRGLTRPGAR